MNDLQKMKESCKEFAKDLKTGNLEWQPISGLNHFEYDFWLKCPLGFTRLWLNEELSLFFSRFAKEHPIELKSTTAKEAAAEALELVKQEAQKLVDALSEPKEPFWIPIDKDNLPKGDVLAVTRLGYTITGEMSYDKSINVLRCTCVKDKWELSNVTHYHDISKYPKP
jgi:hypothetical protein